ncbi:MAG TPA: dipeptidase PepE [Anaerolineales bacterium]|nr:dipeptidase PepE [Anaerolineales bacterium]
MSYDLLLFSNSRMPGQPFLAHALSALADFLAGVERLVFLPYAAHDYASYLSLIRESVTTLPVEVISLHQQLDPRAALERAQAVFVGGGNTFRLARALHELDVLEVIQRRVVSGELRYSGASAGVNLACPTIRTTNDMPIVAPPSLAALSLLPFQINPHYLDSDPNSTHGGETRELRLQEFLEENDVPVLGLREGAWLRRQGGRLTLLGLNGARLFRRSHSPHELLPGADLSDLLAAPAAFDRPI